MADNSDKPIDKRTLHRQLSGGKLDEKSYERYLKNLPDLSDKAAPIDTLMDDDGLDDEIDPDDEPTQG
jgi:hypothetical protein